MLTKRFIGDEDGNLKGVEIVNVRSAQHFDWCLSRFLEVTSYKERKNVHRWAVIWYSYSRLWWGFGVSLGCSAGRPG